MQQLIQKEQEPITPFIDKVRKLYEENNISTILVMGGSGDYFDVVDYVIGMDNYLPKDLTQEVKKIKQESENQRKPEGGETFGRIRKRIPIAESIDPSKGKKKKKIKTTGKEGILFGKTHIDLSAVEQICDASQTNAIAESLVYAKKYMDGQRTLEEILELIFDDIREAGLNVVGHSKDGNYAMFRKFELAAALNRLRTLKVSQQEQ
jgi:predicted ABC-class ATPase